MIALEVVKLNDAPLSRNGLCGLLPAMELLALGKEVPAGTIPSEGAPVEVTPLPQMMHNRYEFAPVDPKPQPVVPVVAVVTLPFESTITCCPLLPVILTVPPVSPNSRSVSNCPASFSPDALSVFESVIVNALEDVTLNTAEPLAL